MKAVAPGKLILSGEHSVVYGKPSVAMAIDRSVIATIEESHEGEVTFDLPDINEHDNMTHSLCWHCRILNAAHSTTTICFSRGSSGFSTCFTNRSIYLNSVSSLCSTGCIVRSIAVSSSSSNPICLSAASVLSELRALGHYLRVDFRPEWYYEFSMEAEKLQHGHPSGVDSYISLYGGCATFEDGEAKSVPLPRMQMYLVETGAPEVTTGECVVQVKEQFENDLIWNDFEDVTREVETAVRENNDALMRSLLRENHRLLCRIGVVPEKVQVLVLADFMPTTLAEKYNYNVSPVRGDPLGTRIV